MPYLRNAKRHFENKKSHVLSIPLLICKRAKKKTSIDLPVLRAEAEGFEPPEPVKVQRFSRPPLSTTQPHLRDGLLRIFNTESNFFLKKGNDLICGVLIP